MKVSAMFPSRYLQADDLPKHQRTIVTIEKVYPAQAVARNPGDDPEVKWMLRLREFRKPMSLWRNTCKLIAEVLGTEETEDWPGRRIAIYPATYQSFGEIKPCINVDRWAPEQIAPRGGGLVVAGDRRPIPPTAMARFGEHLAKLGGSWDQFLRWAKSHAPEAHTLAWGVALDEVPAGILPAMKAYLDSLAPPASQAPPGGGAREETPERRDGDAWRRPAPGIPTGAAPGGGAGGGPPREVVDAATGELRTAAPMAQSPMPPAKEPVREEDIPF